MLESSSERLNLFFPQWQGANILGLSKGADFLHRSLSEKMSFIAVPTSLAYSLTLEQNILGYTQILSQLAEACQLIQAHNPSHIFTVGGGCGVDIAPVSFLNAKHHQSIAVIWLDAHGDLNTPDSSPSAHFHGMPLRTLLGEGNSEILDKTFSVLKPEQVFLVGTRELDLPERQFVRQQSLSIFSAKAVNEGRYDFLVSAIKAAGFSKIYVHLDLDVIEPNDFAHVACPTPNGIRMNNLIDLLKVLKKSFESVGFSVLEFLPVESETMSMEKATITLKNLIKEAL